MAWIEAARPKTLPASISPVIIGCALAFRDGAFQWIPALLCFGVALLAQIASNFANDYFDFKKGADGADRLGPERAVAQGWISPKAMLKGTFLMLGLACLCGCGLLFFAGLLPFSSLPTRPARSPWRIADWAMYVSCCSMESFPSALLIMYKH